MTLERLMFKACLMLQAKILNAEQCKIISVLTMGSENFRAKGLRLVSRVMMILIESKDYHRAWSQKMSFQPNLDTYHITQVFTWISLFTHYPQAPTEKRIAEAGIAKRFSEEQSK